MIELLAITREGLQEGIRSWMDFGWEFISHPFVSFLIGIFGGSHFNSKVRGAYRKSIDHTIEAGKRVLPKKHD